MFSANDRNQIFDQSRDKEDAYNEDVVKDEDQDENGQEHHHHHCRRHRHHNHRKIRYLPDTVGLQRGNRRSR